MTTKTYTRRDSVTSILRKRGITSDQYNDWIIKNDDGTFSIREQAESSTPPWDGAPKTVEVAAPDAEHEIPEAPKVKKSKSPKSKSTTRETEPTDWSKRTVSSACREHILAGHDNKKVWDLLKSEFKLDDSKKHYPGWYRSEMKRKVKN